MAAAFDFRYNRETSSGRSTSTDRDIFKPKGAGDLKAGPYDIKGDYPWTLNRNKTLRGYVPGVWLSEYKLLRSGELQSLQNTLLGIAESNAATGLLGAGATNTGLNALAGLGSLFGARGRRFASALNDPGARAVLNTAGALAAIGLKESIFKDAIYKPYEGLYPAEPTGNVYLLPYLNVENMTESAGSWRAVDDTNTINKIGSVAAGGAAALGDLSEAASKLTGLAGGVYRGLQTISQLDLALSNPGAAQEKIKAFTPTDTGDSINITFYLYNTTNDIKFLRKNWEFLFTLTYQNLPNRRSINLLDPPCVYDIEVPGYKRFPIAVIENFKVSNEGTTRLVNIDTGEVVSSTPASQEGTVVKLIPEAYKVTLKITSLLTNTRNLYYWMTGDTSNRINVFKNSRVRNT